MTNLSNYILEKLDTLVVVINPNGEIAYINQSVKKLLGYEPVKLIGLSWSTKVKNRELLSYEIKKSTLSLLRQKRKQLPLSSFSSEQVVVDAFGIAGDQRMPLRQRPALMQPSIGAGQRHPLQPLDVVGGQFDAVGDMLAAIDVVGAGAGLAVEQLAVHAGGDDLAAVLILEANQAAQAAAVA